MLHSCITVVVKSYDSDFLIKEPCNSIDQKKHINLCVLPQKTAEHKKFDFWNISSQAYWFLKKSKYTNKQTRNIKKN